MKRPNVKTAMVGIFATFAILFAILGYLTVSGLQSLHQTSERIARSIQPSISMAKDIQIARYSLRGSYSDFAMGRTSGDPAKLEKKIAGRQDTLMETIKAYQPYADAEAEQSAYRIIEDSATKYIAAGQNMIALAKSGDQKGAMNAFDEDLGPIADTLAESVDAVVKFNQVESDKGLVESQQGFDAKLTAIYIILGVSAVLVAVAAWFGVVGIANPVTSITAAMRKLAGGDTALEIAGKDRTDEIGEMANAVEVFRSAAIANRELQAEAEATRKKTEADRARLTEEAEAAAQARLNEATAGLASGLRRLASGDLAFQLSEPFAPDFESLRQDLNDAVSQLGETLAGVAQSANAIGGGTQEIGQGAQDLSRRTEQQAASLEETAAALDQITANVVNSSKRADEARQVAIEANSSAAQSGRVVANAIDAMGKIEQSSSQISSIIGVIDEIAFQTNLLALNAGVEAARAGEAGKGFAVVAQEVRELAQRSAQAAKQIKELIRNSSVEVEGGVKLVRETGTALQTIENLVATINQHMDAIATSSREQSTGLSEVNSAVNQMDQVTQQNAAMVEQTNAASATLSAEAIRMKQLIGRFQLNGGHANAGRSVAADPVSALRQTASNMAQRAPAKAPVVHGNVAVKQEWSEF